MYHVRKGNIHVVVHNLHKKYGPVVRIAPGVLDLDLPDLVRTIYNAKGDFRKVSRSMVSWLSSIDHPPDGILPCQQHQDKRQDHLQLVQRAES